MPWRKSSHGPMTNSPDARSCQKISFDTVPFTKVVCRNACIARWNAEEQCFYHWREKFERIYIETIKYPTDEVEPWWDVFDVVEELPNPKVEIPFDEDAEFQGNRDDLYEYTEEMWYRPKK